MSTKTKFYIAAILTLIVCCVPIRPAELGYILSGIGGFLSGSYAVDAFIHKKP